MPLAEETIHGGRRIRAGRTACRLDPAWRKTTVELPEKGGAGKPKSVSGKIVEKVGFYPMAGAFAT